MQFPILVEPTSDGRFLARIGEPFHMVVTADDAQRALDDLVHPVQARLRGGAGIAALSLANGAAPVTTGQFPADDAYQVDWFYRELMEEMAEGRRRHQRGPARHTALDGTSERTGPRKADRQVPHRPRHCV